MAKQKKEVPKQFNIDYLPLLDEMSDRCFSFCVDKLYPLFNYRVLKKRDIRRIDILEQLAILVENIPTNEKNKRLGSFNYYFFVIRKYFDDFIGYVEGSQEEKYVKRALEIMDTTSLDTLTKNEVEDVLTVFVSSMRELISYYDLMNSNTYKLYGCNIDLKLEDADLLERIWKHKNLVPKGIIPKHRQFLPLNNSDEEISFTLKFAYINSLLYLARGLDQRGLFLMEEE